MDTLLTTLDNTLRTLFAKPHASAPMPLPSATSSTSDALALNMSDADKQHAAGLMRVNHVGEVCAQALYTAQAHATKNEALKAHFMAASAEETKHLAWTSQRLEQLGSRPSLLNPLWYAGAFGLGLLAGRLGDAWSLGFVVETENQVEAHLDSHLRELPAADAASRAIVTEMKADEARHALDAHHAGAKPLPAPIKGLMAAAAKVMTTVAYKV